MENKIFYYFFKSDSNLICKSYTPDLTIKLPSAVGAFQVSFKSELFSISIKQYIKK